MKCAYGMPTLPNVLGLETFVSIGTWLATQRCLHNLSCRLWDFHPASVVSDCYSFEETEDLLRPSQRADRPIASLAFHAQGDLLAVASGHKVNVVSNVFLFSIVFCLSKEQEHYEISCLQNDPAIHLHI